MNQQQQPEPVILRQIGFPLAAFDYLKDFQRDYEARHGVRLTNNQALSVILAEHRERHPINVERGVRYGQTGSKKAP